MAQLGPEKPLFSQFSADLAANLYLFGADDENWFELKVQSQVMVVFFFFFSIQGI